MNVAVDSPFIKRFQQELADDWPEFAVIASISGISDAILRIVINVATVDVITGGMSIRHMVMFLSMTLIHVVTRYILLRRSGTAVAHMVKDYRTKICTRLSKAELIQLERINRSEIELILGRDIATLSAPSGPLFNPFTTAISLILTLGFLALLSPATSLAVTVSHIFFVAYFYGRRRKVMAALRAGARTEASLFNKLNGLLAGFKELKLNSARRHDLLNEHVVPISGQVMSHQNEVNWLQTQNWISVDAFHYLTIGIPLFILPALYLLTGEAIAQVVALVIFTFGSVPEIIISITLLAQYDVAIQSLEGLEKRLERAEPDRSSEAYVRMERQTTFESLALTGLGYSYMDGHNRPIFSIGPMDLTVKRGELIFIVGGNGSGKTTLLRVLSGLYLPTTGRLSLNDVAVSEDNVDLFRQNFSAVFTDFHLFDRLYGLKQVPEERVHALLKQFMLDAKTLYVGNQFTTTDLSTGQRKRLALIAALLEERPIIILDEVAADQDPEFRQYYYETLLPELRASGRTLLVVSHDSRYFHCADRIIRLDYGQIGMIEETRTDSRPAPPQAEPTESGSFTVETPKDE